MDKETSRYVLRQSTTRTRPLAMPREPHLPVDLNEVVMLVGIHVVDAWRYLLEQTDDGGD